MLPLSLSRFLSKHTDQKPSCWVAGPQGGVPPGGSRLGAEEPRCGLGCSLDALRFTVAPSGLCCESWPERATGPCCLSGTQGQFAPEGRFDLLGAVGLRRLQING